MKDFKVGLLSGGFFEYWRMYPGLREKVEGEMRGLYEGLSAKLDVVWSGLADTLEICMQAGRDFRDQNIDLLIICEGTYFPDYMPIQTMEYLPGVPVLVLLTQPQDHVPLDLTYEDSTHHAFGLVGVVQLTGAFKKMGRHFDFVIGALDDPTLYDEVAEAARVVYVHKKLRFLNLGIIGHTFQGMYDLEIDKTKLKATLGPNVTYIELEELLGVWREIPEDSGKRLADEVAEKYRLEGPDGEDLGKACHLGLALEKIAEKHNLDGVSHLCQHLIHVQTGTTPCYANSRLIERGIMVTCEGDIGNLVMMCALHELTGEPAFHGEYAMFDVKENAFLFSHHGAGTPRLARSAEEVNITPTGEKWGFVGEGASFRYVGKPGVVTLAGLINGRDGWEMLITGGEVIDVPIRPFYGEQFTIRVNQPIKEYMEKLCRGGVTHHAAMVYGDVRKQLEKLARLLNIGVFSL